MHVSITDFSKEGRFWTIVFPDEARAEMLKQFRRYFDGQQVGTGLAYSQFNDVRG